MSPERFTIFLDENHCNNSKILAVLQNADIASERHLNHFPRGTPDEEWLPLVGENGWVLLTTDGRIRYRANEKQAVQRHLVRMFYFSSNNMSGQQMADALQKALPKMQQVCHRQEPPFCASISRSGDVNLRETFSTTVETGQSEG